MDREVARLDIAHYRKLLATEGDGAKRQTLRRLLLEEEVKLVVVERQASKKEELAC